MKHNMSAKEGQKSRWGLHLGPRWQVTQADKEMVGMATVVVWCDDGTNTKRMGMIGCRWYESEGNIVKLVDLQGT